MTRKELQTAIEAQQMIQSRNRPTSELWREASDNLRVLVGMLNGKPISQTDWNEGRVSNA
jgi:hypothetical protein